MVNCILCIVYEDWLIMISIRQMRAARALLNWKQSDLAKMSGLSLTALNNIEREAASPRSATLQIIQQAFEKGGAEFTEFDGVRMRHEPFSVQTFEGEECMGFILKDIVATLKVTGGDIVSSGGEEFVYLERDQDMVDWFIRAMMEHGLKERNFCYEGQKKFYAPKQVVEYRYLPHAALSPTYYSVYGNKYALLVTGKKDRLVIIEHEGTAQIHRQMFEENWKNAKPIVRGKSIYEENLERLNKK